MKWTTALLVAVALLVAAPAAQAQMGIGVVWNASSSYGGSSFARSSGMVPIMAFPIIIGEGLVLQPMLGGASAAFEGSNTDGAVQVRLGGLVEYHFSADATAPLIGLKGLLETNSPSVGDSWTNLVFGVFLGATADVAENVSLVGQWGPTYRIIGEDGRSRYGGAQVVAGTEASVTLRWWIFGT